MNPYMLQDLYERLGSPRWFWPAVFGVLFGLLLVGSSVTA